MVAMSECTAVSMIICHVSQCPRHDSLPPSMRLIVVFPCEHTALAARQKMDTTAAEHKLETFMKEHEVLVYYNKALAGCA